MFCLSIALGVPRTAGNVTNGVILGEICTKCCNMYGGALSVRNTSGIEKISLRGVMTV